MLRPRSIALISLAACACAAPVRTAPAARSAPAASAHGAVTDKPVPPPDLDARLIAHYPLRGLVLGESGSARVRFTVEPSGVVTAGELLRATRGEYAMACRRMLEGTIWTPARASGTAVPFSSVFDCRFELAHGGGRGTRDVAPPAIATPPIAPDFGAHWWERYSQAFAGRDALAELRITVGVDGRVRVDAVVPGGDSEVARACSAMLEQGPRWVPAKNAVGAAVEYQGKFTCRLLMQSTRKELSVKQVGAAGPIAPAQVGAVVAERFSDLTHCFEDAVYLDKPVQGQHWLAFEIRPGGEVGRVEWVERVFGDERLDACLTGTVGRWRFPAAKARTIADVQLYVGAFHKL